MTNVVAWNSTCIFLDQKSAESHWAKMKVSAGLNSFLKAPVETPIPGLPSFQRLHIVLSLGPPFRLQSQQHHISLTLLLQSHFSGDSQKRFSVLFRDLCDDVGSPGESGVVSHIPRTLTLLTFSESLLPCKVLGIRRWTSGGGEWVMILPTTSTKPYYLLIVQRFLGINREHYVFTL